VLSPRLRDRIEGDPRRFYFSYMIVLGIVISIIIHRGQPRDGTPERSRSAAARRRSRSRDRARDQHRETAPGGCLNIRSVVSLS